MQPLRALTMVVLAGCGRIGFDARSDARDAAATVDTPSLPLCASDDFSDGIADGWSDDMGRWAMISGPFGPAYATAFDGTTFISRMPQLMLDEIDYEMDVDITQRGYGDLFLQLVNLDGNVYPVSLYPAGSDDPTDNIIRLMGTATTIAEAPTILPSAAGTWARVRFVYRAATIDVLVDGVPHLHVVDTTLSTKFNLDIGFNFG